MKRRIEVRMSELLSTEAEHEVVGFEDSDDVLRNDRLSAARGS